MFSFVFNIIAHLLDGRLKNTLHRESYESTSIKKELSTFQIRAKATWLYYHNDTHSTEQHDYLKITKPPSILKIPK